MEEMSEEEHLLICTIELDLFPRVSAVCERYMKEGMTAGYKRAVVTSATRNGAESD